MFWDGDFPLFNVSLIGKCPKERAVIVTAQFWGAFEHLSSLLMNPVHRMASPGGGSGGTESLGGESGGHKRYLGGEERKTCWTFAAVS